MATDVYYNGVQLHNVVTREWHQEVEYDESHSDQLFTRFKLRFEGLIHGTSGNEQYMGVPAWTGFAAVGAGAGNAIDTYQNVRKYLTQARGVLQIQMGGRTVLYCEPATGQNLASYQRDVDNGPHPIACDLIHIAAENVFRVSFSITCTLLECFTYAGMPFVLSNRWSIAESMDEQFFITRNIRGKIRMSTSIVPGHAFKYIVTPGLEPTFKRMRVDYAVSSNGLDANYSIVDRQTHTAAPWPATSIDAVHTESTAASEGGTFFHSSVQVRMTGSPEADKRLLIRRCVELIYWKLDLNNKKFGQDWFVVNGAIIDNIGESNAVECRLTIGHFWNPKEHAENLAHLMAGEVGAPLTSQTFPQIANEGPYSPQVSRNPQMYGYYSLDGIRDPSAMLYALHCFLQQPCQPDLDHQIAQGSFSPYSSGEPDSTTTTVTQQESASLNPDWADENYDYEEQEAGLYTVARAESTYSAVPCRVQLPIARNSAGGLEDGDDTSVTMGLAATQCRREIRVEAERIGKWPGLPAPLDSYTDGDLKGKLLKHWDRYLPPVLTPDGRKKVYKVEAYYLYALNRPPRTDEATRVGVLQFTNASQSDNAITRDAIYETRLNPGDT